MEAKGASGNEKKNGESKKSIREEKQRDAKIDDQIEKLLKSLGNSTPDQKISSLAKNLVELENAHHRQVTTLKQNEKSFDALQREKDRLQIEYNKSVLIKHKLEQVCREQQKLMKSIKSESLSKIRDEEEKRKETQQHFQQSINEIFTTLGKNNDENAKLKEANLEITKKFKYLAEQYEMREKQLMKTNEQVNLSTQLNEAKLAKIKMESTLEREILLKEKETILEDLLEAKKLIIDSQGRERILKEQLNMYTEKYADFQSSLKKSNDVFETYKIEMTKMTKKIKSLEKENFEWRSKYEKSTKAMLEMASDKTAQDQYVGKAARQLAQLQKLCRTLQAERTSLLDVLKANNIERPPMAELPPEPVIEPPPKSADKLDIMSRNCSELKATLAVLQGQMNALSAEKKTQETPVVEPTQPKKSKNKKNKANKSCPITDRSATSTTNGKTNSTVTVNEGDDVPTNNENASVEPVNGAEQKTEVVVESAVSSENVNIDRQATEEIVKDLIDDLVKDVQAKCSLESQNGKDAPVKVVNGDNGVTSSTTPILAESEGSTSPLVVTELNNDEPVNISAD
ncbi:alpha-taxilin [Bradysia coprophila]|uniref:alpha-taxilin n=1 Tax=Bradysia coprophila TaxID=38358 RepID=UPI00187D7DF4|nr:alpha-taxilin [Bradysia coprophila]